MGRMWHHTFKGVVGKRIQGLVVTEHDESPQNQVFLIFDDGTHYELYGADIQGCKNIKSGGSDQVSTHVRGRRGVQIVLETPEQR